MPTLLVLSPLGSEVRQFGHSGLLSQFLADNWKVVVAAKIVDDDLRAQLDDRIVLLDLPQENLKFLPAQIGIILDKSHALREARAGKMGWEYIKSAPKNWKQRVLFKGQDFLARGAAQWNGLNRILQTIEQSTLKKPQGSERWEALLKNVRPDIVLLNVPRINTLHAALAMAKASNIPVALLYHTWKDVSAAGRLQHRFDAIGAWNESMKNEVLRQNTWLAPDTVQVVGCTHFECVGRSDLLMSEAEFRRSIGARKDSRLILYSAAAPWVIPNEENYIALLVKAIEKGELSQDGQIVVRTNPMDQEKKLAAFLRSTWPGTVIVMEPDWRWEKARNWCFQRKNDLILYNSLLRYAEVCVGIPSTVTIECAVDDLPVVNIGFGVPACATTDESINVFWNADFYDHVRDTDAAALASSPSALIELITQSLQADSRQGQRRELLRRQLGLAPGKMVDAAKSMLQKLVSPSSPTLG